MRKIKKYLTHTNTSNTRVMTTFIKTNCMLNLEGKCETFTHAYNSNQIQNAENDFDFESNMQTNQFP